MLHLIVCLPSLRAPLQLSRLNSLALLQTAAAIPNTTHQRPLHTQPYRQHLSRHARGVKAWEEVAQAKDSSGKRLDFESVCNGMIENLKINRYAKASNITKIFDDVTTTEQLNLAEKALVGFRHSLSRATPALPLVVVRSCIRVDRPKKALHYLRNKVQYGVFPSRRVYHILMDAFIRKGDAAGAVTVYQQMLDDEVVPDGMTFHLGSRAHVMMNTPEGLEVAVSLCKQCHKLEPKLGSKSIVIVVKTLLDQGRGAEAVSLLTELEADQLLLPQTQLNLLTHALVATGELGRALSVLRERLYLSNDASSVPDQPVGLPQEAWPQLKAAVQDSGDEELTGQLENLTNDLISNRKLPS